MKTIDDQDAQLLTIEQVAQLMACSTRTVWRYVSEGGRLQPIRLSPKCIRFRRRDVLAAIG